MHMKIPIMAVGHVVSEDTAATSLVAIAYSGAGSTTLDTVLGAAKK